MLYPLHAVARRILSLAAAPAVVSLACASTCPLNAPQCTRGFVANEASLSALPPSEDADRDGLLDSEEQALAERFAPIVTLHRDDWTRPASLDWVLGQVPAGHADPPMPLPQTLRRVPASARAGAPSPRDWVVYVHVYPAKDGGVIVQYWFYYPYNDGWLWFDHESDWEHVSVSLDAQRNPLGVFAARHGNNAPGQWRSWERIRKVDDTHPEILSAKGSHASYFDLKDVGWQDEAGRCVVLDDSCVHPLWRTWLGGGLRNLGERHAPLMPAAVAVAGRWGPAGVLPGMGSPVGPAYQRGWCVDGSAVCDQSARF